MKERRQGGAGHFSTEDGSRPHQGKAKQVLAAPQKRVLRRGVVTTKADAPDAVARAGFDENFLTGGEQVGRERRVLLKLGDIADRHEIEAVLVPARVVKAAHRSSDALALKRRRGPQDALASLGITKQACFADHHPLLGKAVALRSQDKGAGPKLTKHCIRKLAIGARRVALERAVAETLSALAGRAQAIQIGDDDHAASYHFRVVQGCYNMCPLANPTAGPLCRGKAPFATPPEMRHNQ